MNNIYKVIWSKAKNCYVVASEIARSHTKSASGSEKIRGGTRRKLLASLMALSLLCGGLGVASATLEVVNQNGAAGTTTIYTKEEVDNALTAKGAATEVAANKTDIETLKTAVGNAGSGLTKEVLDQKVDIATNRANINNLDGKLANLTTTVSGKADEAAVTTALGDKANTDLSNLTADGVNKIKNTMSADMNLKADKTYVDNALNDKADKTTVTALEGRVGNVEGKVTTLETTVGNATGGLVKDVADLKAQGITLNNALGEKANQSDLLAATNRITVNEGNITALQNKTDKLSADGKELKDMTTVSGTTVSGDNVKAGELMVTGEIKDGAGVTTTLAKINDSMTQTATNKTDIAALQNKTDGQQTAINGLNEKTTQISYNPAKGTTVNDVEFKAAEVDANGKGLTGVSTLNTTGAATIGGALTAAGLDAGTGAITGGSLSVTGEVKGNRVDAGAGEIKTTGVVNAGTLSTAGNATVGGELNVTGKVSGKGLDAGTGDITGGSLNVTGEVKGSSVDAGAGEIKTTGAVNAGTLSTTGNATVGGDLSAKNTEITGTLHATGETKLDDKLTVKGEAIFGDDVTVKGTTNLKDTTVDGDLKVTGTITTDKMIFGDPATNNYTEIDHGKVTSKNVKNNGAGQLISSSSIFNAEENKVGFTNSATGDQSFHKQTSDIIMDNVKDRENSNNRTQTKTETKDIITDKDGNSSTTSQTASENKTYLKDKDGKNTNSTIDTAKGYDKTIKGENGETSTKQDELNITNTAQNGTITNDAQNIVNNASGNISNKSQTMDTTVTGKATESYGSLDTTVNGNETHIVKGTKTETVDGQVTENYKAGQATNVTGNQDIHVTGKQTNTVEGGQENIISGGQTNTITGGQINNITGDQTTTITGNKTETVTENVTEDYQKNLTTTVGGNEIHDVKGTKTETVEGKLTENFKGGQETNVTGDKKTTVTGKTTEEYKGGLETTVTGDEKHTVTGNQTTIVTGDISNTAKNITNEASNSITDKVGDHTRVLDHDGITDTVGGSTFKQRIDKIMMESKDVSIKAEESLTNEAKVITNKASEVINNEAININNTATGIITSKASEIKNQADKLISNKVGENTWENMEDGKITTSIKDGTKQNLTQSNAAGTTQSTVDGAKSTVTIQNADGLTDAVTDGRNTSVQNQTASAIATDVKDGAGNENASVANATTSANTITNGTKANTVISTADGTSFINSEANTAFEGGTYTDTTIKGNTITTGKVKMDYAEVMKDLGVHGNAKVDQNLEVGGTSTLKGDVTMESNATVKKDLTVVGTTTTKTLKVTEDAEVGRDLSVGGNATITGDVTANSYKVGDKTYISAAGINANDQKITNVADGSISEGSKDAVNGGQLYGMKTDLEHKVDKVGANAAAMANLHPMEFDPDSKWNIAAAMGNYGSETATAIGAFYRPNEDVMVNFSTAFGTGENMVGGGVSVRLGKGSNKLSREESNALKAQVNDLTARMDALLSVLNPNMSKDFPDVPENHWAYEAVSRLAGNDIVQGYPDGEFHGDRTMTRYEMAEIIYNALSRGAEAEKELVEEFKPELQAMAASEKATAEKAEG